MKPRNSISCARLQSKWKCLVQRTEMIWGSLFDDKYIFMRCLSALQIPKAISISYCPLVRRRVAKTKQKWSEEKRNKFNVENSSVFGCTFFKLRYVCVCVCVWVFCICVFMRRVLGSFVGSFFTSILHFGRYFLRNSLATSWLMMAYGIWNGRETHPTPQRRFFLHVIGVFLSSCIEMVTMYSSMV